MLRSLQLLDLESGSSVGFEPMVDSSSLMGSLANSQFSFGAKLDSRIFSVTGLGLVADSESATGLDFSTAECFWFSILRLTTGISP